MTTQWKLEPVPQVPEQIKRAASEATLVIFVGAGISRLMGCRSWDQFADACLEELAKRGVINFGDVQQLRVPDLDAKKRLTIALQLSASKEEKLDLERLIQPKKRSDSKVYEYLQRIGSVYVTTNYDTFLDADSAKPTSRSPANPEALPALSKPELICWPDHFLPRFLREPGTVIHLHGSILAPKSMVITTPQYLDHYRNQRVLDFLEELFQRHTVLFIGYGLDEWEILEHIFRTTGLAKDNRASRFMLAGYFSHQEKTFQHLKRYYEESFGVQLLPFNKDHQNHSQIERILEDWSGRIQIGEPLLADDLDYIAEVANE